MPSDLLSRPLIEIARDLRDKRASARELTETAIARHERFGSACTPIRSGRRSRPAPSPMWQMPPLPPGYWSVHFRVCRYR